MRNTGLIAILLATGIHAAFAQSPDEQLYIVTLKDPPVVEQLLQAVPQSPVKARLTGPQAQVAVRDIDTMQALLVQRIEAALPGEVEVAGSVSYLSNALFVRTTARGRQLLEADPDVRSVTTSELRYPVLDSANSQVNAEALWNAVGGAANAGAGIKIAIIDSGIDVTHPMFRGDGMVMPPGYPKVDSGGQAFINQKLIAARSYHSLFPSSRDQKVLTPAEEQGHGTRVAAAAAGRPVNAPLAAIQGMAPGAWLGNYKVFGTPGINSTTTSAAIIKAVEDAVKDGMDIINLSLGGPPRNADGDPEQEAIARAVQAGVVVVVAAGNEGPLPGSVTSPGTSPAVITVGAVSNNRSFGAGLEVQGVPAPPESVRLVAYTPGAEVTIATRVGPFPFRSVVDIDPSELACNPFPAGVFNGQTVLVKRGTCLFQDKANHVFNAGARAMVVYNNVDEGALIMQFTLVRGPSVMIDRQAGEALRDYLRSGAQAQVSLRAESDVVRLSAEADVLLGFSGRGPSVDGAIKPDLVSVGNRLYLAACTNNTCTSGTNLNGYVLNASGTSFATPMVAGAAAILKQLRPDLSPDEIKGLLVGSAAKTPTDGGQPAAITQVGNGRLDLAAALNAESSFSPVSWSIGPIDSRQADALSPRQFRLVNLGARSRGFRLSYWTPTPHGTVSFQVQPSSVTLGPGGSALVTVTPVIQRPLQGGTFQGYLQASDSQGNSLITAPIWGSLLVPNPDRILTISQTGGGFASIGAALAEAEPGNVVEIRDSGTYSERVLINANKQGVTLDGILLRAASGANPVINGAVAAATSSTIRVSGVRGVRLEGLTVQGGAQGIEFDQAAGAVVASRIRANAESATGYGITARNGRIHVFGTSVETSGGAAIAVSEGSALIQQSLVEPSASGGHSGHGIMAVNTGPIAIFDNRIAQVGFGGGAQGIRLSAAPALAKGNLILNNAGATGDGFFARSSLTNLEAVDNLVSGHGRSGFNLTEGASGNLWGNRIANNQYAGLQIGGGSNAIGDRLWFTGNQNGAILVDSGLTLQNSLVSQSANNGVRGTSSVMRLFNSTVTGNTQGFTAVEPFSNLIVNSIIAGNGTNLTGTISGQVTFSLIGGTAPAGSGNLGGDPGFADSSNGDYRLRADSPAVDRGSDAAAAFDFDLAGHQRKAGFAVDLGALEHGPELSAPLGFPVLSTQPRDFLGLALTYLPAPALLEGVESRSAAPSEIPVRIGYRNTGGSATAEEVLTLTAGSQRSVLFSELFGSGAGWLEIQAPRPEVTGFALLGDYDESKLDGAVLAPARSGRLAFADFGSGTETTRIHLLNPNSLAVNVSLIWTPNTGSIQQQAVTIPAGAMLDFQLAERFALNGPGWLSAEGSQPLSGFLVGGSGDTVIGLPGLAASTAAAQLFGAQLAMNSAIESTVTLVNFGTAANVLLQAFDELGTLRAAATVQVPAGQSWRANASQVFGLGSFVGWLRVSAGGASLAGSVRFSDPQGRWAAALPLAPAGAREFVLSHIAQADNIFTGLTLLNPNAGEALVSIEAFDASGRLTGLELTELSGGQKRALLLPEWIPGLDHQIGGYLRVRSNRPVVGFELFGSGDYLAAVPAQVVVE